MRIIITGAAGFIGSALARHVVLERGWHTLGVDLLTYAGTRGSVASLDGHAGFSLLQADICDGAAMARAFATFGPTHVAHLAAETHVDRSIDGPSAFMSTNVMGTMTLLETQLRLQAAQPVQGGT